MTRTVLTFGDSNTFGTPPMADRSFHPRLARRWPIVMAEVLGCDLNEEGIGGRTVCSQDISNGELYLDGPLGLRMALLGNGPIDDLVIMLGTNDQQFRHGRSSEEIAAGMSKLIQIARDPDMQIRHGDFDILLICPPPALDGGTFHPEFHGAPAKSAALPALYAELAARWGISFLDAGQHIASDPLDAVHFGEAAHETLGRAVAAALSA